LSFSSYNANCPFGQLEFGFARLVAAFVDTLERLGLTAVEGIGCQYDCSSRTEPHICFYFWQRSKAWGTSVGAGDHSKHLPKTEL
jgi:hypothetical protein